MKRRTFNTLMLAGAALPLTAVAGRANADVVRIGVSGPKTGGLGGAAATAYWPAIQLWVHETNEAGGLQVGDRQLPVELVEYDDQTAPEVAIRNVQRLATVDQVDFIVGPYGTGISMAVAPIMAQNKYPLIVSNGSSNEIDNLIARWPDTFWMLGDSVHSATAVVDGFKMLRDAGKMGNKIAVVYTADAFGQDMINAGLPALREAGFEVVYESSYPSGAQDVAPVIAGAKAAAPDGFIAYSYPADTFALTEQAQVQNFNVQGFYVGIGGVLRSFGERFGENATGIMSFSGIDSDSDRYRNFHAKMREVMNVNADASSCPTNYATMQIIGQAMTQAGSKDRAAVAEAMRTGSFATIYGDVSFDARNVVSKIWTLGQWVDGDYFGVAGVGVEGGVAPIAKPDWR